MKLLRALGAMAALLFFFRDLPDERVAAWRVENGPHAAPATAPHGVPDATARLCDGCTAGDVCNALAYGESGSAHLGKRPSDPRVRSNDSRARAFASPQSLLEPAFKRAIRSPAPESGPRSTSWNLLQRSVQLLI